MLYSGYHGHVLYYMLSAMLPRLPVRFSNAVVFRVLSPLFHISNSRSKFSWPQPPAGSVVSATAVSIAAAISAVVVVGVAVVTAAAVSITAAVSVVATATLVVVAASSAIVVVDVVVVTAGAAIAKTSVSCVAESTISAAVTVVISVAAPLSIRSGTVLPGVVIAAVAVMGVATTISTAIATD